MRKVVENLDPQIMELYEENEKLMGQYEEAKQERNALKSVLSYSRQKGLQVEKPTVFGEAKTLKEETGFLDSMCIATNLHHIFAPPSIKQQ